MADVRATTYARSNRWRQCLPITRAGWWPKDHQNPARCPLTVTRPSTSERPTGFTAIYRVLRSAGGSSQGEIRVPSHATQEVRDPAHAFGDAQERRRAVPPRSLTREASRFPQAGGHWFEPSVGPSRNAGG